MIMNCPSQGASETSCFLFWLEFINKRCMNESVDSSKLAAVHAGQDSASVIEAINHDPAAVQRYYYCVADAT